MEFKYEYSVWVHGVPGVRMRVIGKQEEVDADSYELERDEEMYLGSMKTNDQTLQDGVVTYDGRWHKVLKGRCSNESFKTLEEAQESGRRI